MITLPDNFSLEGFAELYVSKAVEEARKKPSPEEFDLHLFEGVAKEIWGGDDASGVVYLHHAFHWAFFLERGSMFEQVQSRNNHDKSYVYLKEEVDEKRIKQFADGILERNRQYLEARVNSLRQAA